MKKSMIIATFFTSITLFTFSVISSNVFAQQTGFWTLPPIDCSDSSACEIRLSFEGDLYIYFYSTATLYVSRQDASDYSSYNLQPYARWITGGITDLVPFTNQNIVMFYGSADLGTISRLDLATGDMTIVAENSADSRVVRCNNLFNDNQISRIGQGSQLMFCSVEDHAFFVNIWDVVTQTTVQRHDFSSLPWGIDGYVHSWSMLVGGQDGEIYISAPSNAIRGLLDGLPQLPDLGWRLLRYNTQSENWLISDILPEQMASVNYRTSHNISIADIVAIMDDGSIIYRYEWWDSNPAQSHGAEISRYDVEDFRLVERLSTESSNTIFTYVGISADGLVLLQELGMGLEGLFVDSINPSLLPDAGPQSNGDG